MSMVEVKVPDIGDFKEVEVIELMVKVGVSYVSVANARANLAVEQPGWDFPGVR